MDTITRVIEEVHQRYAGMMDGALADYIPELARADPAHFGISLVTADGALYAVGDVDVSFTIQSVSKAFTYGMALDARGSAAVEGRVGVEPSGEAFNSISLDPGTGRPRNPMINAGAIVVTGLLPDSAEQPRFEHILSTLSRFAGRDLEWDKEVYASESATGFRNRAIANLLRSFDIIDGPTEPIVEDYFRQCSIEVTCTDLATMAATLACVGVNPVTGDRVLTLGNVEKVLSVMATCGMYDYSGTWVYEVGLPAKSGVGGGVLGVLPGQFGVALFSPLLDEKFNTVRGVAGFRDLSQAFDLHLLRAPSMSKHAIRRRYRLSDVSSRRGRPDEDLELLAQLGRQVLVLELQGDLFAASLERVIRALATDAEEVEVVVLDLRRAGATDGSTVGLLRGLAENIAASEQRLMVADPAEVLPTDTFVDLEVETARTLDDAMRCCEDALLVGTGRTPAGSLRLESDDVRGRGSAQHHRHLPQEGTGLFDPRESHAVPVDRHRPMLEHEHPCVTLALDDESFPRGEPTTGQSLAQRQHIAHRVNLASTHRQIARYGERITCICGSRRRPSPACLAGIRSPGHDLGSRSEFSSRGSRPAQGGQSR